MSGLPVEWTAWCDIYTRSSKTEVINENVIIHVCSQWGAFDEHNAIRKGNNVFEQLLNNGNAAQQKD